MGALTAASCVAIGVLMGVVWSRLAPIAPLRVTDAGAVLDESASGRLIADDGWFAVLGLVLGLLSALAGWVRWRQQVLSLGAGLALGGLAGGLVAWRVGAWLGPAPLHEQAGGAQIGAVLHLPLSIRALAVLLVWPITALITLFAAVAGSAEDDPDQTVTVEAEQAGEAEHPRSGPAAPGVSGSGLVGGPVAGAGDGGEPGTGGGQQVGWGELEVQPAPPAGDQN